MPALRLFGPPSLLLADGRELALSAREAALLGWLHLEGPSARARLAGLLWPGGDEARARTNLRQTLARLRRAAGSVLDEDDGVLRLAAGVQVRPAGDGDLLAGLDFDDADELADWLARRRDDARRERQRGRLAAAQEQLAAGELDEVLAQADAVLADEPESEQAWRLRMEVLYLRGDRAAAIAAWDECREVLRRSFGVSPSEPTNELGKLILASSAAPAAAAQRLPAALLRPPNLIGRAAVLAAIEREVQLRHAVVVAGPGGIGKSRVIGEALAVHAPALRVAARAGDRVLPGASFARLLETALRAFAPALDEPTRQDIARLLPAGEGAPAPDLTSALEHRRVLASAARALQACARQGLRLLAFDDLQFADEASIAALQVLIGNWLAAEENAQAPGLVPLIGVRDAEVSMAGAALLALLADSRRSARFDLAPLGEREVRALLDELPLERDDGDVDRDRLASALHAQVGGNPAFLLESLKSLWLDRFASWRPGEPLPVPATLLESLRRRLQRLPESALQVAQLAAVAQRDFTLALAAAALGRAPLAMAPILAELEAAQIFHGHAFSHDLVAEAVRASVPAALVGPLHRLVAEHLIAHGGAAAAIAFHLQQAGAEAAAVAWHLKAAQEARDRWQEAEAAAGFEAVARGLEAHPGAAGEATAAMAWRDAARAWISLSRYEEALQCLERGLSCARSPRERLRVRASWALALLNGRRYAEGTAEAFALTDELETHADELDPAEVAAALFASAIGVPYSSQPQRVAELCERLRERCASGPPRVRQTYHLSYGLCLTWMGRPLQAEPELDLAWQIADEIGDLATRINIANQMTRSATMRGDFARALSSVEACLHAVQAAGHGPGFRADALSFRATVRLAQGRPAEAMADLHQVQAIASESGRSMASDWVAVLAMAWLQRGRAERARDALTEAGGSGTHRGAAFVRVHLARDDPAALETELAGLQRSWPADEAVMGLRRRVLMARLGRASAGEIDALLAELEARGLRPLLRSAHLAAARCAGAKGDREAAAGHARRALAMAEMVDPWVDDIAAVWLEAAQALRAAGALDEADAALADGRSWVEQAASTLENEEERRAWREGNATHRALLGRIAVPQG